MTQLLLALVLVYGTTVGLIYLGQRSLLYIPDTARPDLARAGHTGAAEVTYPSADGLSLLSWYFGAANDNLTLVYFQGNAGNIGDRADKIDAYLAAGYGVMLVGYRGYGGNPGRPDEAGLYADGRAALTWLAGQGIHADRIVLYGESLGSAVATRMAYESARAGTPVRGLVLEAPFTSMGEIAQIHYPFLPAKWLVKDRYPTIGLIDQIDTSLLIIHGLKDRTIPAAHGRRLHSRAAPPKSLKLFDLAAHNDLYDFAADQQVMSFFSNFSN